MKATACLLSMVMAAAMILMAGCESDDSPDEVLFRNNSTHQVSVTLAPTSIAGQTFTLSPNGGTAEYPEIFVESYTYTPMSTVIDRRDGNKVIFENRPE